MSEATISNPTLTNNLLRVNQGGTGESTAVKACEKLNLARASNVGLANEPVPLNSVMEIDKAFFPAMSTSSVNLMTPLAPKLNTSLTIALSDYSSFKTYDFQTDNGSIAKLDDKLVYTPARLGPGYIMANGRRIDFTVSAPGADQPYVILPTNLQASVARATEIRTSAFSSDNANDTHQSSDWQLSRDAGFTDLVLNVTGSTFLTSYSLHNLLPATDYYVRVRYNYRNTQTSAWSKPVRFTTTSQEVCSQIVGQVKESMSVPAESLMTASSLAYSSDAGVLVVGQPLDPREPNSQGIVSIYRSVGHLASQIQYLPCPIHGPTQRTGFGTQVAISKNGDSLVVHSQKDITTPATLSVDIERGAVSFYNRRSDGTYEYVQSFTSTVPQDRNNYASSIVFTPDGQTLLAGHRADMTNGNTSILDIYSKTVDGSWTLTSSHSANRPSSVLSMSLSPDAATLYVLADVMKDDFASANADRVVYIFVSPGGVWQQHNNSTIVSPTQPMGNKITALGNGRVIVNTSAPAGTPVFDQQLQIYERDFLLFPLRATLSGDAVLPGYAFAGDIVANSTGTIFGAAMREKATNALKIMFFKETVPNTWTVIASYYPCGIADNFFSSALVCSSDLERLFVSCGVSSDGSNLYIGA